MGELICKGNCGTQLISAFEKPPNYLMYWCADCLYKKMLEGYSSGCHECGELFDEEINIAEHWHDKHAASHVPGTKEHKDK